jgi:hypothetical protein
MVKSVTCSCTTQRGWAGCACGGSFGGHAGVGRFDPGRTGFVMRRWVVAVGEVVLKLSGRAVVVESRCYSRVAGGLCRMVRYVQRRVLSFCHLVRWSHRLGQRNCGALHRILHGKTTTPLANTTHKDTPRRPCTAQGGGIAGRSLLCGMKKLKLN